MAEETIDAGSTNTDTSTAGAQSAQPADAATTSADESLLTGGASTEAEGSEADESGNADESVGGEQTGDENSEDNKGEGESGDDGSESGAPETYEFSMPEGFEIDQELSSAITPVFKDLGLTQEQANKIVDAYSEAQLKQSQIQQNAIVNQRKQWGEELKADQDFGGDAFEQNVGAIREFMQKTVPEDIRADLYSLFDGTGVGDHPALVRYMHHLATKFPVGEDVPDSGKPVRKQLSREERMYRD